MLYIENGRNVIQTWHVGDKLFLSDETIDTINSIQADGDELSWITENFKNLPHRQFARVERWYGDTAKQIVYAIMVN